MESIKALNRALLDWDGNLVFVRHDRELVSSLATRVLEIRADRVVDFQGSYLEYV